jgi:hypothetical protein
MNIKDVAVCVASHTLAQRRQVTERCVYVYLIWFPNSHQGKVAEGRMREGFVL